MRAFAPALICMSVPTLLRPGKQLQLAMELWLNVQWLISCGCTCRRLLAAAARTVSGLCLGHAAGSNPTHRSARPQACPQGPPSQ